MRKTEYLIIGNGIAGLSAAKAIRANDKDGSILMVTRQKQTTYLRPLLSKAGMKLADPRVLQMVDEAWHKEKRIELLTGTTVQEMDVRNHIVRCEKGSIEYRKCIYALGGDAWMPPVRGQNLPGIFVLRNIEDIQAIRRCTLRAKRAAVIGGGVIGMEIGEVLYRRGMQVTVLEMQPRILPRVLDQETAENYIMQLARAGRGAQGSFRVQTNVNVEEILGEDRVTGIRLADGGQMECDLVIFSCGIRSCVGLAERAGMEVDRAVIVDESMRTSAEDVFACGDCAQFQGTCAALWEAAMEQGRIAGLAACGVYERYRPKKYPIFCNSSLVSMFAAGDLAVSGEDGYRVEVLEDREEKVLLTPRKQGSYMRLVYRKDRLVGAALIGNLAGMQALKERMTDAEGSYE